MATQLSTKVGLCTHFWVFGYWMKQCVSCLKYYFTLSLPFEQRLVFRLCCNVQNVVSIIISTQYQSFLRFFFWHLVINGRVKPNLFIAQGESPIQTRQTDLNLSPFFTQATSPSSDTPSSTSFFAKLLVHVTSGWKFHRNNKKALCFINVSDI